MTTRTSRHPYFHKQATKKLSTARQRATEAKAQGLDWYVEDEASEISINVTVLAYCESRMAAKRWIDSCVRSLPERIGEQAKERLRQKLWAFWRGE